MVDIVVKRRADLNCCMLFVTKQISLIHLTTVRETSMSDYHLGKKVGAYQEFWKEQVKFIKNCQNLYVIKSILSASIIIKLCHPTAQLLMSHNYLAFLWIV